MNARNMIPKRPMAVANKPQINQRSFIPKPFGSKVVQNVPAATVNSFPFPARQLTVNGVEKSGIPRPQYQPELVRPLAQKYAAKPAGSNIFSILGHTVTTDTLIRYKDHRIWPELRCFSWLIFVCKLWLHV